MNWGSIIGLIVSVTIFVGAIVTGTKNYLVFINTHALALVIGGSFAAAFISFRGRYVIKSFGFILKTLRKQKISPITLKADVKRFMEWSRIFSTSGLDGLAKDTEGDPFMERCIYLAKSEYDEELFKKMATDFIESDHDRQTIFADILTRLGETSPAFGMVGTLVGLIIMLQEVGADPTGIAKGIGLALIATLYGVISAKVFYEPFAFKIKEYLSIQRFRRGLILEGFAMLIAKKNPFYIMDALNCKLDPKHIYTREGEKAKEEKK